MKVREIGQDLLCGMATFSRLHTKLAELLVRWAAPSCKRATTLVSASALLCGGGEERGPAETRLSSTYFS